jgi:hypothetical protein
MSQQRKSKIFARPPPPIAPYRLNPILGGTYGGIPPNLYPVPSMTLGKIKLGQKDLFRLFS